MAVGTVQYGGGWVDRGCGLIAGAGERDAFSNLALLPWKSKSVVGTVICSTSVILPARGGPRLPPRFGCVGMGPLPPPLTRKSPNARSTVSKEAAALCTGFGRRGFGAVWLPVSGAGVADAA